MTVRVITSAVHLDGEAHVRHHARRTCREGRARRRRGGDDLRADRFKERAPQRIVLVQQQTTRDADLELHRSEEAKRNC
jgi:hypothetical protein